MPGFKRSHASVVGALVTADQEKANSAIILHVVLTDEDETNAER
jgi:hypothetical protein